MEFATKLIGEKIANSMETLLSVIPEGSSRERAIAKLSREHEALLNRPPKTVNELLGIEGQASGAYFRAWEATPLNWRTASRRPIPETWRSIGLRSAIRGAKAKNSGATHPLNAMCNYAYAVLQAQLQIQAVADGFDPTRGIMHQGRRGAPALVFDLMKPRRPKVDAAVLAFALSETFSGTDFVIRSDGVVRLPTQLAKRVCQLADR